MADELLLTSENVIPHRLLNSSYTFRYTDLDEAFSILVL